MQRNLNPKALKIIQSLLDEALQLARNTQLNQAIERLKTVLEYDPIQGQALNLLAEIYRLSGQLQLALSAAQTLHTHYFQNALYHNTRGTIYNDLGDFHSAISDYEKAIRIQKTMPEPYINIVNSLRATGQIKEALKYYAKAQAVGIRNANLDNNIGALHFGLGDFERGLELFEKGCKLDPSNQQAQENRIKAHVAMGVSSNLDALKACIAQLPILPIRFATELSALLTQHPCGEQLKETVQTVWLKAISSLTEVQFKAELSSNDFLNKLFEITGNERLAGRAILSTQLLERASSLRDDDPTLRNNLGVSYFAQGNYAQALVNFKHAQRIKPEFPMAWRNIGVAHLLLTHPEESRAAFEKAYEGDPTSIATQLYLFGQSLQCCEWQRYHALKQSVLAGSVGDHIPDDMTASLAYLAAVETADDMRQIAAKVANNMVRPHAIEPFIAPSPLENKASKLKIGYFSYDFRVHPVGYLTQEIYALHDHSKFEIYALSYGPDDGSEFRKSVEQDVDYFINLEGQTTAKMVQTIRDLKLDIVVDLTGNTQGNKSEVIMHRVAPIQCHWLGYVWSMGHINYDYIIADPFSIPFELEHGYVEKVARLPFTLQVASRKLKAAETPLTRASQGLADDAFVMCNFGSFGKLQPDLFRAWMRVLKAVPKAVLWLARTDRSPKIAFERLMAVAVDEGVNATQIVFGEPMSRADHLRRYELADLALDTYPQGSGTTAIEALWMGCPMLSMAGAGETLAVRMAGGILNAVELNELVVNDLESYEKLAITLGKNRQKVSGFRKHLLSKKFDLPLFNTPQQVKYLESALTTMFEIKRNNRRLESFTVSAKQ